MYLNVYVPKLQYEGGARWYLRTQRGHSVPTSAGMGPLPQAFVAAVDAYAAAQQLPVLTFKPGERKDDVVKPYLARFAGQTGLYLVGKAQEKTTTFRTHKGHGPRTQDRAPQLYRSTAMVKHYYLYGVNPTSARSSSSSAPTSPSRPRCVSTGMNGSSVNWHAKASRLNRWTMAC